MHKFPDRPTWGGLPSAARRYPAAPDGNGGGVPGQPGIVPGRPHVFLNVPGSVR